MSSSRNPGEAARDAQNQGLKQEQERLRDPAHLTPDEEKGEPIPADQLGGTDSPPDSIERLKNPPQVDGPREENNDMV
jgi:hypothetical protein